MEIDQYFYTYTYSVIVHALTARRARDKGLKQIKASGHSGFGHVMIWKHGWFKYEIMVRCIGARKGNI